MLSLLTLIIDSILIPFENSINAQALQHESAMVDVYTKMKPDSFKLQLQAVLTAFYEDIKGVQGASGCPNGLPQDQDPQAPIRGPRGRRNNAARTRLASRTRAVPPPPLPQARQPAAAAPPTCKEEPAAAPAFAEPAPSPPERRRDGMVRGLRADAD
jgi:hypothetical protein